MVIYLLIWPSAFNNILILILPIFKLLLSLRPCQFLFTLLNFYEKIKQTAKKQINAVMDLQFPQKWRISWLDCNRSAYRKGLFPWSELAILNYTACKAHALFFFWGSSGCTIIFHILICFLHKIVLKHFSF